MATLEVNENGSEAYTKDGSVDLKGNPILKAKSGGWKACSFVVVYEVFERMAYYGVAANLFLYLTKELHEGTIKASNNVTYWVGTVWMTPILGAYIADAFLGRYWTFVIASSIYFSGMCLLTLSVTLNPLKPHHCIDTKDINCQKVSTLHITVFFAAIYTLAVGTGGTKPNISTIGADQFDEYDPKQKLQKLSFFNWWMFSIFFGTLFANTVLIYIQDNVGWGLGYGLPSIGLGLSIVIFLAGTKFYRHKIPSGSPFTKMAQVIIAAIKNYNVPFPKDENELYELDLDQYQKNGKVRIGYTPTLRFLSKACIKKSKASPWRLTTVTQAEETKQMLRMIPILIATFIPSTMIAQINTLFIKQGTTLDRNIGHHFKIPPASLQAFVTLSMLISVVLYDRVFMKIIRRWTKNPRGITLLQRMGIGMVFHIIIMVIASLTERYRLKVAKDHRVITGNENEVPLSIFILLPQFILMGTADAFLEVAKIEFFYDQAPENMKSLGTSYAMTSLGAGNFISSFLLSTISRITRNRGNEWIKNNLNASHLDYYYGFFAVLNVFNVFFFLVVARLYVYKAEVSDSMVVLKQDLQVSKKHLIQNQERGGELSN